MTLSPRTVAFRGVTATRVLFPVEEDPGRVTPAVLECQLAGVIPGV
jgi:hypothetical protein